ncbi:MAG: cytochrome c-type biogenesis protein CcmH [Roseovarius sp.]|nr:cytochrome c-type biogenesis protein CcmH [Roseovarius sp.]
MKRLALVLPLFPSHAIAVEPDEILGNTILEERARGISAELRCLVCMNESIDDSNAELARDLRILVRERLLEGDPEEEVFQYIVDRYGEFVLLKPDMSGSNLVLWLTGPAIMVLGGALGVRHMRRRSPAAVEDEVLTREEQSRLSKILKDNAAHSDANG